MVKAKASAEWRTAPVLDRVTFKTSRLAEFFEAKIDLVRHHLITRLGGLMSCLLAYSSRSITGRRMVDR
jgi:hypothetical protein